MAAEILLWGPDEMTIECNSGDVVTQWPHSDCGHTANGKGCAATSVKISSGYRHIMIKWKESHLVDRAECQASCRPGERSDSPGQAQYAAGKDSCQVQHQQALYNSCKFESDQVPLLKTQMEECCAQLRLMPSLMHHMKVWQIHSWLA